jgi:hypothetical protein
MNFKQFFALALAGMALASSSAVDARSPYAGMYRLAIGPDGAGALELKADGHFRYQLSAGALDEHAEGTWTETGGDIRLTTTPKPVPMPHRWRARMFRRSTSGWPTGAILPGSISASGWSGVRAWRATPRPRAGISRRPASGGSPGSR